MPWDAGDGIHFHGEMGKEGFISMGKWGTPALPPVQDQRPPEGEAAPQQFGELGMKKGILSQSPPVAAAGKCPGIVTSRITTVLQ